MAAEERKGGEMGFYFIGPQPASICPDSTVFLIMAKPEKKDSSAIQTQTQRRHLHLWEFCTMVDAKYNPAQD